jgi:hypothetical protein
MPDDAGGEKDQEEMRRTGVAGEDPQRWLNLFRGYYGWSSSVRCDSAPRC